MHIAQPMNCQVEAVAYYYIEVAEIAVDHCHINQNASSQTSLICHVLMDLLKSAGLLSKGMLWKSKPY